MLAVQTHLRGLRLINQRKGWDPKAGKHNSMFCFISSYISDSIKPSLGKPEARVTGFSHMTGSFLSARRKGESRRCL